MNPTLFNRISAVTMLMGILLSSCELQKRRYSSGFYVKLQKNKAPLAGSVAKQQTHPEIKPQVPEKERSPKDSITPMAHIPAIKEHQASLHHPTHNTMTHPDHHVTIRTEQSSTGTIPSNKEEKAPLHALNPSAKNKRGFDAENNDLKDGISQKRKRRTALIIGLSLLLMAAIAAFAAPAMGGVFVLAEPVLTALNVTGAPGKFRGIIIGWIAIFILDILVSIGVYNYYKDKKPKLALTNGVLRLVYSAFLGAGIAQLLRAVSAPNSAIYGLLQSFHHFWSWGLIVFGLHLIALGILYHNEGGKKWVNISIKALLIIAGLGYMILNTGILLSPNPAAFTALIEPIFIIPQILGEVLFAVWMVVKGGKNP